MGSTKDLIKILESQIGYRESGNNHQKYSPAVPTLEWSQNQPWCVTFNAWAYMKTGLRANVDYPVTASCLAGVAWYRKNGRWGQTPKVGSQVFYGPNGGTHVEIVVAVSSSYITTIGGNTSGSLGGAYYNGDGVYKKSVARSNSRIYGYGHPNFSSVVQEEEDEMPDYVSVGKSKSQALPPNTWVTVEWDVEYADSKHHHWNKGGTTFVVGPALYSAYANVAIEGLNPGTELQARIFEVAENGKVENGPLAEYVASQGKTFVHYDLSAAKVVKGQRVRFQVIHYGREAGKVTGGTAKAFVWK